MNITDTHEISGYRMEWGKNEGNEISRKRVPQGRTWLMERRRNSEGKHLKQLPGVVENVSYKSEIPSGIKGFWPHLWVLTPKRSK